MGNKKEQVKRSSIRTLRFIAMGVLNLSPITTGEPHEIIGAILPF
ncbi:MAG TPA: hypothetical protein VEL70_05520 [Candidatus Acidoferrum sp.]|nr:hypothetical protein [Candidatus Acidoferrum sp.]